MNDKVIQAQRKSYEFEEHWQLRNAFLNSYCDVFPRDKLLSLAQAFVNVETLGVKYNDDLMEEIDKLSGKVPYLSVYRALKGKRDESSADRKQEKKNSSICNANSKQSSKSILDALKVFHNQYEACQRAGKEAKESTSHKITSSISAPSSESNKTGNDLVEKCENMYLEEINAQDSARTKLDEWCVSKFGCKPVYDISRVGPGCFALTYVKVVLPNKEEFGLSTNPNAPSNKMFEDCASLALYSLQKDDHNIDLSNIKLPVLPPPPPKWF